MELECVKNKKTGQIFIMLGQETDRKGQRVYTLITPDGNIKKGFLPSAFVESDDKISLTKEQMEAYKEYHISKKLKEEEELASAAEGKVKRELIDRYVELSRIIVPHSIEEEIKTLITETEEIRIVE